MTAATFNVNINGYYRDSKKNGIPNLEGVYFVYTSTYNPQQNTVTLHNLIYIGESDHVNLRIQNHEKYDIWKMYLQLGQELCYSVGQVVNDDRFRVEAAYIFRHKPPVNTEYVNAFPFDQTTVNSLGETTFIDRLFTVFRT